MSCSAVLNHQTYTKNENEAWIIVGEGKNGTVAQYDVESLKEAVLYRFLSTRIRSSDLLYVKEKAIERM